MHRTPSNHMTHLSIFIKELDTVKSFDLSLDTSPLTEWHDEADTHVMYILPVLCVYNHCVIVSSHTTDVKNR